MQITFTAHVNNTLWPNNCVALADGLSYAHISRVSSQKGRTRHAYTWQIGPFWQDTLDSPAMYKRYLSTFGNDFSDICHKSNLQSAIYLL